MSAVILNCDPSTAEIPTQRLLGAYGAEIRMELLRTLRNVGLVLPVLLVPVGCYLLFAVVIAGEAIAKDPDIGVFMFAGFAVLGTSMPALFGISSTLAMDRELGLNRLRRAQPAPTGSWLIAKLLVGLAFCVLAYLPMLIAAITAGKLALSAGQLAAMSIALLAGAVPFCALGLLIGTLFRGSSAPGYANLIYLPGCYLSGLFFPLPKSMHFQAPFWPHFHVDQLAMHAAGVAKFQFVPVQLSIGALLGFTVVFSGLAMWRLATKG